MATLVLLKRGETTLDTENRFVGWNDADLTEQGKLVALMVGKKLKQANLQLDVAYTSVQKQDIRGLWLTLEGMDNMSLDILHDWRFNSRHLGAMQGLNIAELAQGYGQKQLSAWLNNFEEKPPQLDFNDPEFSQIAQDPRYSDIQLSDLPLGESLLDVTKRTLMCWNERLTPAIREGVNILLAVDEANIRALIMFFEKLSPADLPNITLSSDTALVYDFNSELQITRKYFI
jgi:2,3-bisphosphoglycerate-dependent phosphoglycerate mutase